MLYPQQNRLRIAYKLDGVWDFCTDPDLRGEKNGFPESIPKEHLLSVPGSWHGQHNDLYHYQGRGWYQTRFTVPYDLNNKRIVLRFGAVTFCAKVWLDGQLIGQDTCAFLPFELDVTDLIKEGCTHVLTVAVDGLPDGVETQAVGQGDFYEYAGIHRSVYLCITDKCHIRDLAVTTSFNGNDGVLTAELETVNSDRIDVSIGDSNASQEVHGNSTQVTVLVADVQRWSCNNPFLYDLSINLYKDGEHKDQYTLLVGFRTISLKGRKILLNDQEIFLKGFGKHEDSKFMGRGYFEPQTIHDFNLMKWCGANSFRTSHYPYSEEILSLADRYGFLVISETPFVNFNQVAFNSKETANHAVELTSRLINRDKNHPSVISWSIGNECATNHEQADSFFLPIIKACRKLDTRPITYVAWTLPEQDKVYPHVDIIGFNRYYGWYRYNTPHDTSAKEGDINQGTKSLSACIDTFAELFDKPLMMSEFGADAIAGFHSMNCVQFSEEFQERFIDEYLQVVAQKDILCGAHIWNLADFATRQGVTRVDGNKKGIFTREREPKRAAFLVRKHWTGEDSSGTFAFGDQPFKYRD